MEFTSLIRATKIGDGMVATSRFDFGEFAGVENWRLVLAVNFFNAKRDTLYQYGVCRLLEDEINFRKTRGAETIFLVQENDKNSKI